MAKARPPRGQETRGGHEEIGGGHADGGDEGRMAPVELMDGEGIGEIEQADAEEADVAEGKHAAGPGGVSAEPVGAVEEEALTDARRHAAEDCDPGGCDVQVEHG